MVHISAGIQELPSSTETRIEELYARIHTLCGESWTPEIETELEQLAQDLACAIKEHVETAKSSLEVKHSAIVARDPGER